MHVSVCHILGSCPNTLAAYVKVAPWPSEYGCRGSAQFFLNLFVEACSEQTWQQQMQYVGACINDVARHPSFRSSADTEACIESDAGSD